MTTGESARTGLTQGKRSGSGGGGDREAVGPGRGAERSPASPALPSCHGERAGAAPVGGGAFRDPLIYDNVPADTDCLVCQGRRQEMSCFFPSQELEIIESC